MEGESSGRPSREPLVTAEMIGLFVVFGADLILLVVLLAAVGVVGFGVAAGVTGLVLAVYGAWVGLRWYTRRTARTQADSGEPTGEKEETPLETLKRRYASGELSDEEFEAKLDRLLDSDRQSESVEEDDLESLETDKQQ